MLDFLVTIPLLFAVDAAATPVNPLWQFLPLAPIPIFFYIILIRPKQQEDRERLAMIDTLKKNDKVLTTAGIYGTVVSLDPDHDRVVLRVDDDRGIKLTFSRSSVLKVFETTQDKAAESA